MSIIRSIPGVNARWQIGAADTPSRIRTSVREGGIGPRFRFVSASDVWPRQQLDQVPARVEDVECAAPSSWRISLCCERCGSPQ